MGNLSNSGNINKMENGNTYEEEFLLTQQGIANLGLIVNTNFINNTTTHNNLGTTIATNTSNISTNLTSITNLGTTIATQESDLDSLTLTVNTNATNNTSDHLGFDTRLQTLENATIHYLGDGSNTAPSYSFTSDTNTGMYRSTADTIDFTCNGVRSLTIKEGTVIVGSGISSETAPGLCFDGDLNTGIFSSIADHIMFTCGGTERVRINSIGNILSSGKDTPGAPNYSFANDFDSGLYNPAANELGLSTNGIERMRLTNTGMGLGVTAPSYQLELSTDSAAKPTSSTWTISSDRRLKKNVLPLQSSLDVLNQLNFVSFDWSEQCYEQLGVTGKSCGLIADEVANVLPQCVSKNNQDVLQLNYHEINVHTTNAVKELYKYIKNLQARLRRLEMLP